MIPAATWVRPPKRARLHRSRRALQVATSLVFIAAPFVDLFRFDFSRGVLVIAGTTFGLSDLQAVYVMSILFMVIVFAGALLYGRIYCGWMCPQTTLSEWVASVERWACKRVKAKAACAGISALTTVLVSAFVSASLVSYFVAPQDRLGPPRLAWIGWGLTTVVLVFFLGLRHRFCLLVCPYGILQNVIQDRSTLGVTFDQARRSECTDCLLCVRSCFMGLDPRVAAFDARCLNCGDCIAATTLAKRCPKDVPLISFRYGSEPSTWPAFLRKVGLSEPKRVIVVVIMVALTGMLGVQLAARQDLELDIAAQFERTALEGDVLRNGYRLSLVNRLEHPVRVTLETVGLEGLTIDSPAGGTFELGPASESLVDVVISTGACRLSEGVNDLKVKVSPEGGPSTELPTFFFVPSRRVPCAGSSASPSPPSSSSSALPSAPPSAPSPSSST